MKVVGIWKAVRPGKFLKTAGFPVGRKTAAAAVGGFVHDESLGVFLLEDEGKKKTQRQQEGGGLAPKGCMAVYVGGEMRRFVIPVSYLGVPAFLPVMEMVKEEFGFRQTGALCIPCAVEEFEEILAVVEVATGGKRRGSSKHLKWAA